MEDKVYIIDLYNKFSKDEIISTFLINGRRWAIKKVSLQWGKPKLSAIEESEDPYLYFHLFNSLEEAEDYIRKLKKIEGVKF